MNDILRQVMQSPGYSTALSLSAKELALFRTIIEKQWISAIRREHPKHANDFEKLGIDRYHEKSNLLDHSSIWNKSNRYIAQSDVEVIKKQTFFRNLTEIFGEFKISDVVYDSVNLDGEEEIYWRLVRPGVTSDVGGLHADKWFHELGQGGRSSSQPSFTIKVWIPIYCEPGKSGLMVVPESHKKDWDHGVVMRNGTPKPMFLDTAQSILLETQPGNLVIFREETLHGGAVNLGEYTRVSAEITLVFPRHKINSLCAN